jgi:hypothetical protein
MLRIHCRKIVHMHDDIYDTTSHFLRANREACLIEAVIDTSVPRVSEGDGYKVVPYLNLWAFNAIDGRDLVTTLRGVANTDDWGYLEDIVQEQDSSSFEIALESIYPLWPDDFDEGTEKIVNILISTAKLLPSETIYLFHHIDAWPSIDLKTGRNIDLSLL